MSIQCSMSSMSNNNNEYVTAIFAIMSQHSPKCHLPYRGEKLYSLMAEEILDILNTIKLSESFGEDALLSAQYVLQCSQPA